MSNRICTLRSAHSNISALLIIDGEHDKASVDEHKNFIAHKQIMKIMENDVKKAESYFESQHVYFLSGIIAFSIWHISQIFSN